MFSDNTDMLLNTDMVYELISAIRYKSQTNKPKQNILIYSPR